MENKNRFRYIDSRLLKSAGNLNLLTFVYDVIKITRKHYRRGFRFYLNLERR